MAPNDQYEQPDDEAATEAPASSAPGTVGPPQERRSKRFGIALCAAVLVVTAAVVGVVAVSTTPTTSQATSAAVTSEQQDPGAQPEQIIDPLPVSDGALAALPQATTFTTVSSAPLDTDRATAPSGRIVHPATTVALYGEPGGDAIAALPPTQFGADTWLPVIAEQPGWVRVMLPVRPAGATAWLYLDDPRISLARTPYRIVVDRANFTLTLLEDDRQLGQWTVGVGKANSLTPEGRTFILASIKDTHPTFSPVILPLGTHSATYTTYGGGPGTVGIHTWPTASVYGKQASDGCVRVPPDALDLLSTQVPIGTPVLIR